MQMPDATNDGGVRCGGLGCGRGELPATPTHTREESAMKRAIAMFASVAFFAAFTPLADAQSACPPEVAKAKEMLHQKTGWIVQENIPKEPDVKMPRSLAGARPPEVQAPRGQDGQAPRGQDSQASRGQEVQAPRGQDTQAPRGQDIQAPRA